MFSVWYTCTCVNIGLYKGTLEEALEEEKCMVKDDDSDQDDEFKQNGTHEGSVMPNAEEYVSAATVKTTRRKRHLVCCVLICASININIVG